MSNPLRRYLANQLDDYARDLDAHSGKASRLYRDAEADAETEAAYDGEFDSDLEPSPNWLGGLFLGVAFAAGWAGCYLCMTLLGRS